MPKPERRKKTGFLADRYGRRNKSWRFLRTEDIERTVPEKAIAEAKKNPGRAVSFTNGPVVGQVRCLHGNHKRLAFFSTRRKK